MKRLLLFLVRWFYRYEAHRLDALKSPGPVLLIPNHVSWLDWLFLMLVLDDDWKFVTSSTTAQTSWLHRKIMINRRTFPIDTASPYAVKRMAEFLNGGGRLVLFAEGRLSRTGTLMKLFDGTGFLLHRTAAKVITCYLRGAQRLPFSPNSEQHLWFPKVTAHFSDLLTPPKHHDASTSVARTRLTTWLRDQMVEQQFAIEMEFGPKTLAEAVAETAEKFPRRTILQDASMTELSYRKLLVGVRVLAEALSNASKRCPDWKTNLAHPKAQVIHASDPAKIMPPGWMDQADPASGIQHPASDSPRIGVLLPNVNAMPVAVMAAWCLGKVPAVLNFSTGPTVMLQCCQLAGLQQVITSRLFVEKARLNLKPLEEAGIQFLYLEDVRQGISKGQKLAALLRSFFGLRSWFMAPMTFNLAPDLTAVVLFTSGSEGVPKGVELTHRNVLANIRQMLAVTDMQDTDRMFNCLPLFHSFGLSVGTFLPLVRGMFCFVYPSPLHYRIVPAALYDRDCSVLLATNTFLNGYARRAHPYDFRSMRYLFAAAEKVQQTTYDTWAQKFGVRILEGYGATECSPCVSVCTPLTPKHGSAGRMIPGMEWKVEPVEGVGAGEPGSKGAEEKGSSSESSPAPQPPGSPASATGRLLVRGPNVMKGYLNPDANAKFQALGGWYDTGDIVRIDDDKFVHILGRLKRFAKVSGEMVSLTAVEDALAGAFKDEFGARCETAVVAVPDEDKGERLIAIANEPKLTLDHLRTAIKAKGLTNLCVPREIKFVKEIPKLGTGKVNHRELLALVKPS